MAKIILTLTPDELRILIKLLDEAIYYAITPAEAVPFKNLRGELNDVLIKFENPFPRGGQFI